MAHREGGREGGREDRKDIPVDVHLTRLTNAMRAVLRLCVHGWVPVGIVKDDLKKRGREGGRESEMRTL